MGENSAGGESILGGFVAEAACCLKDSRLSFTRNAFYLHSFYADNLKYVHGKPFGYNKCEFSSTLKEALMIKIIKGEKKYDY